MSAETVRPDSLNAALLGAILAALGYVGKVAIELIRREMRTGEKRRASLVRFRSLLSAARVTFIVQNEHAQRLVTMLTTHHPEGLPKGGFERIFGALYDSFTPEERELHEIIRAMTQHSLYPVNEALAEWLRSDTVFKAYLGGAGRRGEFARYLQDLEAHLILWLAKFRMWIPDQPRHALVYMADEQQHGLGFPDGLDGLLDRMLGVRSNETP